MFLYIYEYPQLTAFMHTYHTYICVSVCKRVGARACDVVTRVAQIATFEPS